MSEQQPRRRRAPQQGYVPEEPAVQPSQAPHSPSMPRRRAAMNAEQPLSQGWAPQSAPPKLPPFMAHTAPRQSAPEPMQRPPKKEYYGPHPRAAESEPMQRAPKREYPRQLEEARPLKQRKLPSWLTTTTVLLFMLCGALLAANMLMQAYLQERGKMWASAQAAVYDRYPLYYTDLIERNANEYNLEPAYVAAIILNESSFKPEAESSVGARGLMQLMPDTASWIARKMRLGGFSFTQMYDPETNVRFGCWYLNYLSRIFRGAPVLVTAAYHAGQGQVSNWLADPAISRDGATIDLDSLPEGNTKKYVRKVTQAYGIYNALYGAPPAESGAGAADAAAGDPGAGN